MKKLKKITLTALGNVELKKTEMHKLLGGDAGCCSCGCRTINQEDSTIGALGASGVWDAGIGYTAGVNS